MPKASPTKKQKETYDFIVASIAANGYPPTYDEIRIHHGLGSIHAAELRVARLVRKGWLRRDKRAGWRNLIPTVNTHTTTTPPGAKDGDRNH